ncbi:MAG: hypothetical protein KAR20_28755, partial [Candidatus Heimdallarchaeota archaeon]|nr:hypothetical protein [Candidatus Heimdallarchaeota archaeon]
MTVTFITSMCTHYGVRLYELLSKRHDVNFYFTGGEERYWNKENQLKKGNIRGIQLKKFFLFSWIKIVPGLFRLF